MRRARAALSEAQRAAASHALCERLLRLCDHAALEPGLHRSLAPIGVYLATPGEPDMDEFIRELLTRGMRVVAPRDGTPQAPAFAELRDLEHGTRAGRYGVRVPLEYSDTGIFAPRDIGVVLVPGLAFARDGGRLGHGGGWYDRVLPHVDLSVGICFECQLLDEVPRDAHDAAVDVVVTPAQTLDVIGRLGQGRTRVF
jgi:5-formyltetrahydrofolate cyclo-ligase